MRIDPSIPYGLCQCGCGETTPTAPQAIKKLGFKRGDHYRFVYRHHYRMIER